MKGMKRAISAVLTVLTTAALAVTVYAADYSDKVPPLSNLAPSVSVSTETVKDAVSGVVSGETVSGTATVEVRSIASLPISSSVMKALSKSKDAVLKIVSPKATITIDASKVTKVRKVDLSAKVYGSATRSVVDLRSKKDFGCEVQIEVTSCKMSKAKLANAHLYRDGEDLGTENLEINENGKPVITITKGGKYEIK